MILPQKKQKRLSYKEFKKFYKMYVRFCFAIEKII